jgi:4-hydroxybenzoate polyprenyltransferase
MSSKNLPLNLLFLSRPRQWVKNALVFAPLIFARELFNLNSVLGATAAWVGFSLAAGAIYVFNDISDAGADRLHPTKRFRPIASGAVSVGQAQIFGIFLLALSAVVTVWLPFRYFVAVGLYLVVNISYNLRIKHIALLDVFSIAAGFMLRVLAGAFAIFVPVSSWLVLCTMFVSLFLAFAKRRGELLHQPAEDQEARRKVLNLYSREFLDQMITITAAGTVISYALYTVSSRTVTMFATERLIYTTVFVCYGIFRYLYLVYSDTDTENPTRTLTTDVPILVNGVLWILACVYIIYTSMKPG